LYTSSITDDYNSRTHQGLSDESFCKNITWGPTSRPLQAFDKSSFSKIIIEERAPKVHHS